MLSSTVITYSKCLQLREWQLAEAGGWTLSQLVSSVSSPLHKDISSVETGVCPAYSWWAHSLLDTTEKCQRREQEAFFDVKALVLKSDTAPESNFDLQTNCILSGEGTRQLPSVKAASDRDLIADSV